MLKKPAVCNTCTLKLVEIAYKRRPWFMLVREPLKLGMMMLAWVCSVDPNEYDVRTASCKGCMRFYKMALKEKSALFRWLNSWVNAMFDNILETVVSKYEVAQAKSYAKQATGQLADK